MRASPLRRDAAARARLSRAVVPTRRAGAAAHTASSRGDLGVAGLVERLVDTSRPRRNTPARCRQTTRPRRRAMRSTASRRATGTATMIWPRAERTQRPHCGLHRGARRQAVVDDDDVASAHVERRRVAAIGALAPRQLSRAPARARARTLPRPRQPVGEDVLVAHDGAAARDARPSRVRAGTARRACARRARRAAGRARRDLGRDWHAAARQAQHDGVGGSVCGPASAAASWRPASARSANLRITAITP